MIALEWTNNNKPGAFPGKIAESYLPMALAVMVGLVILLNYYDIMHTIELCATLTATEGNPLIGYLLAIDPRLALIVKTGIGFLFAVTILIYAQTYFKRAFVCTSLVMLVYLLTAIWHMAGLRIMGWFS